MYDLFIKTSVLKRWSFKTIYEFQDFSFETPPLACQVFFDRLQCCTNNFGKMEIVKVDIDR